MGTKDWESSEWKLIHERRKHAFGTDSDDSSESTSKTSKRPDRLIGLTLSGGGIRSALYNDGFLQGLSHHGFLRFIDYLASVSGGGYIAGHLIAQARKGKPAADGSNKEPCFHDDNAIPNNDHSPRWHLGRDPISGEVNRARLAGVGGYLSRPLEILPAYLWACFFSVAFYLGSCGVLASLTAIFWRTFDDPNFRIMYSEFLGIRVGDELLIAFLPTLVLFILYFVAELCLSTIRWIFESLDSKLQGFHTSARALSLVLLALAVLTSIAIFLGNGTTNVSANAQGSIYLNHYAQWLAVIAGTLQIFVFFGSDRLFRSERQQAKQWQKTLQRTVSVGVTFFLVFSMIHWMGRENISEFVDNRDPYLVRGDVTDWITLKNFFGNEHLQDKENSEVRASENVTESDATKSLSLDIEEHLPAFVRAKSSWTQALVSRQWGLPLLINNLGNEEDWAKSKDFAADNSLPKYIDRDRSGRWHLEQRFYGALLAYYHAHFTCRNPKVNAKDLQSLDALLKDPNPIPVTEAIRILAEWLPVLNAARDEKLKEWNDRLDDPELMRRLITGMLSGIPGGTPKTDSPDNPPIKDNKDNKVNISLNKDFTALMESRFVELTPRERKSLITAARRIGLLVPDSDSAKKDGPPEKIRTTFAEANRVLLERLFPNAIRAKNIPSTMVVPPYDQQARQSWLGFWLLMATVGALGGVFRHQVATVFQFYRRQLGANFLVPSNNRNDRRGDVPMCDLEPTSDGLPYPLILAASMEPVMINGSYTIQSKTFMFTPKFCGYLNDDNNRIHSKQVALSRGEKAKSVTLADAVTLSGAAVTPLMTTNRSLSLLVDIFNTGLGMQLYRTENCNNVGNGYQNAYKVLAFIVALGVAAFFFWISNYSWGYLILSLIFALTIGICLVGEKGVPHFLKLLIAPKEIGPSNSSGKPDYSHKSFYVADGGFTDYLGVTALLERRCELIVISDAGANIGDDHLGTLAKMCETVSTEMGIRFLDLDHEAPIDFGRLKFDERRLVHQPYLCMRVRYPEGCEGLVIYCQMAISDSDPIEIQQIRNRFPTFPDEPTVNQFYTDDQVAAYRSLGYHIASRMCRELERWNGKKDKVTAADQECEEASVDVAVLQTKSGRSLEFSRFSDALMNRKAMKQALIARNVPKFEVLRERLLTAYRLACYEEVSYRKDDIFSEAVWPMSEYAFPNFLYHAENLQFDKDSSLECTEAWLRTYESSADVRSAYRKAVLEDINVLEREVESYAAGIIFRLAEITGKPLTNQSLLSAHMAVLAVACQEIHRGRPHAAFQIGGRRKLVEMCWKIAETISATLAQSPLDDDDKNIGVNLGNIIAELLELERAVFQGSEHVTTISFAQCVSVMWGRLMRGESMQKVIPERISNRAKAAFESSAGTSTESRMLKARQELDRGLKRVNLEVVASTLTRLWYLGYFNTDAGHVLDVKAFHGFDFLGFRDIVAPLATVNDSVELQKLWLGSYYANKDLRRGYEESVNEDARGVIRGIDARSTELWSKLRNTATSISEKAPLEHLLAAHIAAKAVACIQQTSPDTPVNFSRRHYSACKALSKQMMVRVRDIGSATDDWSDDDAQNFAHMVRCLGEGIFDKADSLAIGRFARSTVNDLTGMLRQERDVSELRLDFFSARDAFETLGQLGDFGQTATVDLLDARVGEAIKGNDSKAAELLLKLWYVSLVDKTEMDDRSEMETEPARRPTNVEASAVIETVQ